MLADLGIYLGTVTAAMVLHHKMLVGILRMPMDFFDTIPLGRVLARFSKDTEVVDEKLPWFFADWMNCACEVFFVFMFSKIKPTNTFL